MKEVVEGPGKPSHLLVFFRGALGDSILFRPVLLSFLRKFPQGSLTLAGPQEVFWALLPEMRSPTPTLGGIKIIPHSLSLFLPFYKTAELEDFGSENYQRLKSFLTVFTRRLFVTKDESGIIENLLNKLGLEEDNVFHPPFPPKGESVERHHMELARKLGWIPSSFHPDDLKIGRLSRPAKETSGKKILIHPGSGGREKNWPLGNFLELARRLAPHQCFFLLGPAEENILNLVKISRPESQILHRKSLGELLQLLPGFDAYIGNDSGISHLAARIGIPSFIMIPAANRGFWDPPPEGASVIPTLDIQNSPTPETMAKLVRSHQVFSPSRHL